MFYVNGVGYADDTTYNNQIATTTSNSSSFDNILKNETAINSNSTTLEAIFTKASTTYNVPKNLLEAVAKAESNFQTDVTSASGAQGIMQLMPSTAASLGVTNAYDPEQAIMGGAKLLSDLLNKYNGDTSLALAAYNAGSGNVAKYGGIPPFTETQNYVKKVLGYMGSGTFVPDVTYTTAASNTVNNTTPVATTTSTNDSISFATEAYLKSLEFQQKVVNSLYNLSSDDKEDETFLI